jgi:hypothetical protein
MLPKINASTKIDKWKPLFAPVVHCARMPISFGDTVSLMEAVVEEFHVVTINKKEGQWHPSSVVHMGI